MTKLLSTVGMVEILKRNDPSEATNQQNVDWD
jgi:hypothetical protein